MPRRDGVGPTNATPQRRRSRKCHATTATASREPIAPDVDHVNGAGSTERQRQWRTSDTYSKECGKHKQRESLGGRQEWV